jgi:hypothetical protein
MSVKGIAVFLEVLCQNSREEISEANKVHGSQCPSRHSNDTSPQYAPSTYTVNVLRFSCIFVKSGIA